MSNSDCKIALGFRISSIENSSPRLLDSILTELYCFLFLEHHLCMFCYNCWENKNRCVSAFVFCAYASASMGFCACTCLCLLSIVSWCNYLWIRVCVCVCVFCVYVQYVCVYSVTIVYSSTWT